MYDRALPSKRKNDDYRESFITRLLKFLWRAMKFIFRIVVSIPIRWLWRATVWTVKAPFRMLGWTLRRLNILINGPTPEFETAREREIYRRIRGRYRRRNRLITHGFVFAFGNMLLWSHYFFSGTYNPGYPPSYAVFTLAWAFLMFFHYVRYRLGEAEDTALEMALEREYERATRSQPTYYEEVEEYYGDGASYQHLTDDTANDDRHVDGAKAKRRKPVS